jgi:hypothetical protein
MSLAASNPYEHTLGEQGESSKSTGEELDVSWRARYFLTVRRRTPPVRGKGSAHLMEVQD